MEIKEIIRAPRHLAHVLTSFSNHVSQIGIVEASDCHTKVTEELVVAFSLFDEMPGTLRGVG